jgi:hypothetical protein
MPSCNRQRDLPLVAGRRIFGKDCHHQRRTHRGCLKGVTKVAGPPKGHSIYGEQLVVFMDSKVNRLGSRKVDSIASRFHKKEGKMFCFATGKIGEKTNLVNQRDEEKSSEQAIEKNGALDRHGLSALLDGRSQPGTMILYGSLTQPYSKIWVAG